MVLYFGSATFKIVRLLLIAVLCVHLFACLFYRIKKDGADSQEDVEHFYNSRNVMSTVRRCAASGPLYFRLSVDSH